MIEATRNKCRELWEHGKTCTEIGAEVGVCAATVARILRTSKHAKELRCIYPGLEAWRQQHSLTLTNLCGRAGLDGVLARKLAGENFPERLMMWQINALLKLTGLTYEEAFGGVDVD